MLYVINSMDILTIIGKELIKKLTSKTFDKIKSSSSFEGTINVSKVLKEFPERLELHTKEILKWSSSIPLMGYNNPQKTERSTVELMISSGFSDLKSEKFVSEEEILNKPTNTLIVGQPGSGKTTTLKRILLNLFLQNYDLTRFSYPILIRLRNLRNRTISQEILQILNIESKIETEEESYVGYIQIEDERVREVRTRKTKVQYVGKERIEDFIPKLLNAGGIVLFLDGLDEIPTKSQERILREIEQIGLKLDNSKIILTVRKTKLFRIVEGFSYLEIKPLDDKMINEISNRWLENGIEFQKELRRKPYVDLANRPIFLTFLLILYRKLKSLPNQPNEIYKEATYLIVKDWDEQREITRSSKYSDFGPRRKLKFLGEISYHLTYLIKTKSFTSRHISSIYKEIHQKYSLPSQDLQLVIAEIESHNGIVSESDFNSYEFSHLSIQEYLCAEHIVTLPFSKNIVQYFFEYPEPLAIATCISGEPSLWFANLLLNENLNVNKFRGDRTRNFKKSLFSYLTRLIIESPLFSESKELGYSLLYLIFEVDDLKFADILDNLLEIQNAKSSLFLAASEFKVLDENDGILHIHRKKPTHTSYFLSFPYKGYIRKSYVPEVEFSKD